MVVRQKKATSAAAPLSARPREVQTLATTACRLTYSRNDRVWAVLKRVFDVASVVSLLLLVGPLLLSIALILAVHFRGRPLFIQERVGQNGRLFPILKFRTMQESRPGEVEQFHPMFKPGSQTRTDPLGRWLRRTSLDELPQLFNVLVGHMSIVGPRPIIAEEVRLYYGSLAPVLLMVRPGMTGLWQVNGRSNVHYPERAFIELKYATTASIWRDIEIILKTPVAVLTGKGAH